MMTEFLTAPRPLRSVLIANRGEIACRVIATCRRLGLRSIAVYSDADAGALHVRLADQALRIGPATAKQSYLDIAAVIAAARAAGADAVHPGYGFLSENAAFVRACDAAGVVFVGPSAAAVAAMGSKIEARRLAGAAGVPVVPGFDVTGMDPDAIATRCAEIGWPVMVKAAAGGGGRGMRRVERAADLSAALASARVEAGSAFGDDTVFIEKLIEQPRHLEVQVFGDGKGGALHFHERDCSVQRNHQKVIEEAPAPNLRDSVRATMFDAALKLTRAIDYAGAGTIEFIMAAGSDSPYFLEMNTRLQVEHPVTEAICGVDLVEWQLRQAAGLPLPLRQDQIVPCGHAIELRLNAEQPQHGFLPSTGTLRAVVAPAGLRFDTGIAAGSEIGSHYDSLLAKLIAHGPDRATALARLSEGLQDLALPGIGSNQAFLADCLRTPAFAEGRATTAFLAETFPGGWQPDPDLLLWLRGQAALSDLAQAQEPHRRADGFRLTMPHGEAGARVPLLIADDFGTAEIVLALGGGTALVESGSRHLPLDGPRPGAWSDAEGLHIAGRGLSLTARLTPLAEAPMAAGGGGAGSGHVMAPLAGLVSAVHVAVGDRVAAADPLVIMEAMKLVHTLTAPRSGTVARVNCAVGQSLKARTILIELTEETD